MPEAQRALQSRRRLAGARAICRGLATYPVAEREGRIWIDVIHAGGVGARAQTAFRFRVVSNAAWPHSSRNWCWSRENGAGAIAFTPGDYLQLDIPAYDAIRFRDFEIPEPFATVWKNQHVFDLVARNPQPDAATTIRSPAIRAPSGSCASMCASPRRRRARTARPAWARATCSASSRATWSLPSVPSATSISSRRKREMVYIGGGAGMAPLRAHLSHLLETEAYRAQDQLLVRRALAPGDFLRRVFPPARSEPSELHIPPRALLAAATKTTGLATLASSMKWCSRNICATIRTPRAAEYYLCGPPMMIKACTRMLASLGVPEQQIAYDEF